MKVYVYQKFYSGLYCSFSLRQRMNVNNIQIILNILKIEYIKYTITNLKNI